jgi:hypothetical protein
MKLEPQCTQEAYLLPLWQRFFCHALISSLPDDVLPEVKDRLAEILEDHFPRHGMPLVTNALEPRVFMAQQGSRHPRPEIEIEE